MGGRGDTAITSGKGKVTLRAEVGADWHIEAVDKTENGALQMPYCQRLACIHSTGLAEEGPKITHIDC
jgi:hypothetical protein